MVHRVQVRSISNDEGPSGGRRSGRSDWAALPTTGCRSPPRAGRSSPASSSPRGWSRTSSRSAGTCCCASRASPCQGVKTGRTRTDPDYEAMKNRVLQLYAIADGRAAAGPGDPAVVIRLDELGPLNLQRRPGKRRAPPRPGAARTGRLVVTLGNQTVIGQLSESVAAMVAFAGVGTRVGADRPARGVPRGQHPVDPARPLWAVGRRHRRQGLGGAWRFRAACVAHRPRPRPRCDRPGGPMAMTTGTAAGAVGPVDDGSGTRRSRSVSGRCQRHGADLRPERRRDRSRCPARTLQPHAFPLASDLVDVPAEALTASGVAVRLINADVGDLDDSDLGARELHDRPGSLVERARAVRTSAIMPPCCRADIVPHRRAHPLIGSDFRGVAAGPVKPPCSAAKRFYCTRRRLRVSSALLPRQRSYAGEDARRARDRALCRAQRSVGLEPLGGSARRIARGTAAE
jgi:hypothetical protein